jgi:phage repressor protein C with HTH and peptisase S24 domain
MKTDEFLIKINGFSCFPDLLPDKIYSVKKIKKPKKGDFLVFKYKKNLLVKRVKKITKKYIVFEDNFKKIYIIKNKNCFYKVDLKRSQQY